MHLSNPLHIAVVGHTNTGKTSLLRTLSRDRAFGVVDNAPGTTRQVCSLPVLLEQQTVLVWYDTPGLEDSVSLRDWIDGLTSGQGRLDGLDRVNQFLQDQQSKLEFEQEWRVLEQVVHSDAMLYVVDARDQVLAKHRDELYLLQCCARPVLPVLNFVASPHANPQPWIQVFARHGMHIHLAFDSISPPINGEQMMYETLGQLLGEHKPLLQALAEQSVLKRRARVKAAIDLLSALCLDVAAVHSSVKNEATQIDEAVDRQQQHVRDLEQTFVEQLLSLYQFSQEDYLPPTQGWAKGQWQADLFSQRTLKELGLDIGKGAAVGAVAGAAVDVLSAGLSLGTGTLIGAAAGSAWQGIDRWGKSIKASVMGERDLVVARAVLLALATRNIRLVAALEQRGHASQRPVVIADAQTSPEFDHAALLACCDRVREQTFTHQVKQFFGATVSRAEIQTDIAQILSRARTLEPLTSDGLH
ncbi:GTPase/DUF3482 domain-containing protein [Orrella daihaiensis]|uniref:GTPase/DUF3482 domain-containing protein n=1 Tax=Orrella daihaiensis TaxID=2782176 RepID=A0ABY4AMC2_9BURK|nr:GTPase/DUF3482 domain-containing protein [Orrella daihaiensis]UOD50555.1 GTPase/DUF3482 domain-containing protein [Orrella daihaiensis]